MTLFPARLLPGSESMRAAISTIRRPNQPTNHLTVRSLLFCKVLEVLILPVIHPSIRPLVRRLQPFMELVAALDGPLGFGLVPFLAPLRRVNHPLALDPLTVYEMSGPEPCFS